MTLDELAKKHDVCSLALSKELKEAGVPQKSLWWWHKGGEKWYIGKSEADRFPESPESISAPHGGELGEMLPVGLNVFKMRNNTYLVYYDKSSPDYFVNTLPNALARMVKYLLDKGIIKKEDL